MVKIASASVPTTPYDTNLAYTELRVFQKQVLEWYTEKNGSVCAVTAPTGSGKSAVFSAIAQSPQSHRTLLVYPTNALLTQQTTVLKESAPELNVVKLTAETLTGTGVTRLEEVLQHAQNPTHDVVITNPDILQALFSYMYHGDTGQSLDFFKHFSAVIYDEFHFYSALGASGILTQIHTLTHSDQSTKIVLASATPDTQFLEHISTYLQQDVTTVRATPVKTHSKHTQANTFRRETRMKRYDEQLADCFEQAKNIITERVNGTDKVEPCVAIIFNSAYNSNKFQEYLADTAPTLSDHVRKDNGYDTNAEKTCSESADEEFAVLNTTSKGEVGLHYDIDTLIMQKPFTASQFLQRFGRAGRQSEAVVHVFGLGAVPWPEEMTYSEFETEVYDTFTTPLASHSKLWTLRTLRSCLAVQHREMNDFHRNTEMYHATETPQYSKWKSFVESVYNETGKEASYGPLDPKPGSITLDVLDIIVDAFEGLRSLRGQTLSYEVEYPNGSTYESTTYDLVRALSHYGVLELDESNEKVVLGGEPGSVHLSYNGLQKTFDGHMYESEVETEITSEVGRLISNASFNNVDVEKELVKEFCSVVPLNKVLIPEKIETDSGAIGL